MKRPRGTIIQEPLIEVSKVGPDFFLPVLLLDPRKLLIRPGCMAKRWTKPLMMICWMASATRMMCPWPPSEGRRRSSKRKGARSSRLGKVSFFPFSFLFFPLFLLHSSSCPSFALASSSIPMSEWMYETNPAFLHLQNPSITSINPPNHLRTHPLLVILSFSYF